MTLVIAVPTSKGLVVAADSRHGNEVNGRYCDEGYKLIELDSAQCSVLTVTNTSAVLVGSEEPDLCKHLREPRVILDFAELTRKHLVIADATIWQFDCKKLISHTIALALTSLGSEDREIVHPLAKLVLPGLFCSPMSLIAKYWRISNIVIEVDDLLAPSIRKTSFAS